MAIGNVIFHRAGSIGCAIARIHTLFIDTSQMVKTVFIDEAFIGLTSLVLIVRVTFGVFIAVAKCLVLLSLTIGIAATSGEKTRILTFLVYTGLVIWTI